MSAFLGGFSFLIIYIYWIIPLAPIIYIFLKWRSYRDNSPADPQLGMKSVLYYFKTLAYHACLAALSTLFFGLIKSESKFIEIGLGLFISSGILFIIQFLLIQKLTNTAIFPLTARVYNGFNMIIVGLVTMVSFMISLTLLISDGLKNIHLPLTIFIVYSIAMVIQTISFCNPVKKA